MGSKTPYRVAFCNKNMIRSQVTEVRQHSVKHALTHARSHTDTGRTQEQTPDRHAQSHTHACSQLCTLACTQTPIGRRIGVGQTRTYARTCLRECAHIHKDTQESNTMMTLPGSLMRDLPFAWRVRIPHRDICHRKNGLSYQSFEPHNQIFPASKCATSAWRAPIPHRQVLIFRRLLSYQANTSISCATTLQRDVLKVIESFFNTRLRSTKIRPTQENTHRLPQEVCRHLFMQQDVALQNSL